MRSKSVMNFRLQYLGFSPDYTPGVLWEHELSAPEIVEAVRQARKSQCPRNSIGWRLVDLNGAEIASGVKDSLREEGTKTPLDRSGVLAR